MNEHNDGDEPSRTPDDDVSAAHPDPVSPPDGMWSGTAPLGSITSPCETGSYRVVLRDYAGTAQIEGSLVALDYEERDSSGAIVTKTVLGQVSKMHMENIHHKPGPLGALLREKGRIPGLSGYADQKEVDVLPMDTIIVGTDIHQLPRTIPLTGTDVRFASVADVAHFSGQHQALYNIGHLYETEVPIGLLLKHFGAGDDGWGDAHMLGIFGPTGSGKSVMGASVFAGFAARREMGMLIVDPQGQFSGWELGKDPDKWSWRLNEAFRRVGRGPDVRRIKMEDVSLESPALFVELLERLDFFDALSIIGSDKKEQTMVELTSFMSDAIASKQISSLGDLAYTDNLVGIIVQIAASTYADPAKQVNKMQQAYQTSPFKIARAKRIWEEVREKFDRTHRLGDLIDDVLINRKIVILDVFMDEKFQDLYCAEILDSIAKQAQMIYNAKNKIYRRGVPARKYENAETNALIVVDEAHRFAPQATGHKKDLERMKRTLQDAIRTTRKLRVGWCYMTQSIAEFDKGIFRQLQTKILGFGIGTGVDNEHLEDALNHDSDLIERYRRLPRPTTTGSYPFAIIGELVALGNGSRALFVTAFKDQKTLFELNPKHYKYPFGAPVSDEEPEARGTPTPQIARPTVPALPAPIDDTDDIPF